jgi:type I restriction enzyme S subunit
MELITKQGYKQTEVGLIPEDWGVNELDQILKFGSGQDYKHLSKGDIPVYGTGGVMTFVNSYLYNGDSVGIGRKGTIDKPVFLSGKFWTVDTLFYTQNFVDTIPKFIYYKFLMIRWKEYNEASGVPSLNKNTLGKIKVALPPTLTEQKAIATALSDVDALIASLEQTITKKKAIKQGAMQQLLTPPHKGGKRLPGFSGEWVEKTLGEVADFYKGKGLPKSEISADGKFKCLHYGELFTKYNEIIDDIRSKTNFSDGSFMSKANDVLMPTSDVTPNGLATASVLFENNVILGGDVLVIRPNKSELFGGFLSYLVTINKQQILTLISGSTVYHLYGSDMAKFGFYLPRVVEQKSIVQILSDMDAEITQLESKKEKYQAIKQGMMQELLTGKTRLV